MTWSAEMADVLHWQPWQMWRLRPHELKNGLEYLAGRRAQYAAMGVKG